jgi:hypothetical protein
MFGDVSCVQVPLELLLAVVLLCQLIITWLYLIQTKAVQIISALCGTHHAELQTQASVC